MKKEFIEILKCPSCQKQDFEIRIKEENPVEIREGIVQCTACQVSFNITDGILDFLWQPDEVIIKESDGHTKNDPLPTGLSVSFEESLKIHRQLYLSLPEDNESELFI